MKPKNVTRKDIDDIYKAKLSSPLVFGDTDQLRILRAWRQEIELFEEEKAAGGDPNAPLLKWRVVYSYVIEDEEIFEARTKDEAEEIALDELSGKDDLDILEVRLVK